MFQIDYQQINDKDMNYIAASHKVKVPNTNKLTCVANASFSLCAYLRSTSVSLVAKYPSSTSPWALAA